MDDTFAGKHISCDNSWGTAVVFDLNTAATLLKGDLLSAKGGNIAIPHLSGWNLSADNVGEDNFLACSVERLSRVPAGSFAKAASVGAKTVTPLAFLRVCSRPRSWTSFTKVLKLPAPTAVSTKSGFS